MPEDERLQRFLDSWESDQGDGLTVRSLHKKVDEHVIEDRQDRSSRDSRESALRDRVAHLEGRSAAEEVVAARDKLPSYDNLSGTPHPFIPTPPATPVTVNVNGHGRRSRSPSDSMRPWYVREPFKGVLKYVLVAIAALALGWLARHFSLPPIPTPKP